MYFSNLKNVEKKVARLKKHIMECTYALNFPDVFRAWVRL